MPARLKDFEPLRPAERRLVVWLRKGNREVFQVSPGLPPEDAPEDVRLRAGFVRYLALGGCDACRTTETGLRMRGAFIESDGPRGAETPGLDLEGCRLPADLGFFACRLPDLVLMRGAETRSVFLNGSALGGGLSADRLEAKSGVFLRGVKATGLVRLYGAKLDGDLDADAATFTAVGAGDAFGADRLEAKGSVLLRGVKATGLVRLLGAKLGGDLSATGATFCAVGNGAAFGADALEAKGGVVLRCATAFGEVRLMGAKLGGSIEATYAAFTATGDGFAVSADGLEAKGDVILRGVEATCEVRFLGAKIAGDFDCAGARLTAGEGGRALTCDGMRVGGTFFLRAGARINGLLDLTGAEIGHMHDDPVCWPRLKGELALNRCRYGAFTGLSHVDATSRIRWLSLQDEARWGADFWPQPWEECARVLREMGHGIAAREVLIEKERRQRAARREAVFRSSLNFGPLRAGFLGFWDFLAGITIRYGRQPLLAFAWLFGFWVIGAILFASAEGQGALKPNLPQIQRAPEWVLCRVPEGEAVDLPSVPVGASGLLRPGETQYDCYLRQPEARAYPRFNALVYSADTLFPVVSLEMQSYWLPDEGVGQGALVRVYLWLHIIAGWGLTLLAVAGFSGLVKQDTK